MGKFFSVARKHGGKIAAGVIAAGIRILTGNARGPVEEAVQRVVIDLAKMYLDILGGSRKAARHV